MTHEDQRKPAATLYVNDGNQLEWHIDISAFEDALCWPIAAADLVNHIANIAEEHGFPREQFIADTLRVFTREMEQPTTELKGIRAS